MTGGRDTCVSANREKITQQPGTRRPKSTTHATLDREAREESTGTCQKEFAEFWDTVLRSDKTKLELFCHMDQLILSQQRRGL